MENNIFTYSHDVYQQLTEKKLCLSKSRIELFSKVYCTGKYDEILNLFVKRNEQAEEKSTNELKREYDLINAIVSFDYLYFRAHSMLFKNEMTFDEIITKLDEKFAEIKKAFDEITWEQNQRAVFAARFRYFRISIYL